LIPEQNFQNTKNLLKLQKNFLYFILIIILATNHFLNFISQSIILIIFFNIVLWTNSLAFNTENYKKATIFFGPYRPGGGLFINALLLFSISILFFLEVNIDLNMIFIILASCSFASMFLSEIFSNIKFKNSNSNYTMLSILRLSIPISLQKSIDPLQEIIFLMVCNYFLNDYLLGLALFSYRMSLIVPGLVGSFLEINYLPLISKDIIINKFKISNALLQEKTQIQALCNFVILIFAILFYDFFAQLIFPQYLEAKNIFIIFLFLMFVLSLVVDSILIGELIKASHKIVFYRLLSCTIYLLPFVIESFQNIFLIISLMPLQFMTLRFLVSFEINKKYSLDYVLKKIYLKKYYGF